MFNPPNTMSVLDRHGGFTAIMRSGDSVWRPGAILRRGTMGTLISDSVRHDDFYQTHRPVVSALYKVAGYAYPVQIWWHPTGERIA